MKVNIIEVEQKDKHTFPALYKTVDVDYNNQYGELIVSFSDTSSGVVIKGNNHPRTNTIGCSAGDWAHCKAAIWERVPVGTKIELIQE